MPNSNRSGTTIVDGSNLSLLNVSRTLAKSWGAGDEIIVSQLDHDSNIRPWVQAAEAKGATVKWAKVNTQTSELDTSSVTDLLTPKTKFVAVTGASNTLGTKPDIAAIGKAVKANGSLFLVDGNSRKSL